MGRMRRTQVYLQPELSAALDRLAQQRGTSRADLIRLAARRLLEQEQPAEGDPILEIVALGDAGPGRTSEEHDRILAQQSLGHRAR